MIRPMFAPDGKNSTVNFWFAFDNCFAVVAINNGNYQFITNLWRLGLIGHSPCYPVKVQGLQTKKYNLNLKQLEEYLTQVSKLQDVCSQS